MDPVPALGEHTDAILAELGYDAPEIRSAARRRGRSEMAAPRTYLFVPGNRPERFAKALASGADAVVLDLEDAVAADAKDDARATPSAPGSRRPTPSRPGPRVVVRINDAASP